jgi:hypothetical protein
MTLLNKIQLLTLHRDNRVEEIWITIWGVGLLTISNFQKEEEAESVISLNILRKILKDNFLQHKSLGGLGGLVQSIKMMLENIVCTHLMLITLISMEVQVEVIKLLMKAK